MAQNMGCALEELRTGHKRTGAVNAGICVNMNLDR
jgi:hypothetical protein